MSTVVIAPNWLGDAVMALPAIADLGRGRADSPLTVAARPSVAGLFELVSGIDRVIRLSSASDGSRWRRLRDDAERLRRLGARRAILFPNSIRAALAVWRAGIPERCGFRRELRGVFLTQAVARPRTRVHQVDYYRHLVSALGAEAGPREPGLDVAAAVRAEGAALLERAGWNGRSRLVGVAPGAAFGGAKRWPEARFAQALAQLTADADLTGVLLGSQADSPAACAVALEAGKIVGPGGSRHLIDLTGRTDLRQLTGVVANCSAFLSNDSGAMHLAAALAVPVVAIFGPTDERVTAPLGRQVEGMSRPVRVLVGEAWCRPCGLRECPIDHRCMTRVGVGAIVAAMKEVL